MITHSVRVKPNLFVFTQSTYSVSRIRGWCSFHNKTLCSRKRNKVIYDTHFPYLKSKHCCHFKRLLRAKAQYLNCGLEYKTFGYSSHALNEVLLITFSFVGATQGCVYCSPLHYCHVANVVAMVWTSRHVLWISIIIHGWICAGDITCLHTYHFLSSWGYRLSLKVLFNIMSLL